MGDGPTDEADADDGEDNSERAQDVFPEKFGVLRVHFLAGGTDGEHDWGVEMGNGFEFLTQRDRIELLLSEKEMESNRREEHTPIKC